MSWNRQESARFNETSIRAIRAAKKLSEKHHFPTGYIPVEVVAGALIKFDPEVQSICASVGINAEMFFRSTPHSVGRLNSLDHPALLLPRVVETQVQQTGGLLQPVDLMRYILQSDHAGIHGILGLNVYRQGKINSQSLVEAFAKSAPPRNLVA